MTVLTSPRGLEICDCCGKAFNPPCRKTPKHRNKYCSDGNCSTKAQRLYEKRSREKSTRNSAQKAGMNIPQIEIVSGYRVEVEIVQDAVT